MQVFMSSKMRIRLVPLLFALFSVIIISGFTTAKEKKEMAPVCKVSTGKAYWFVTYSSYGKYYVSNVFNNDCDHCRIEIQAAFKKFLIMNDYESYVGTDINTYHDVDGADLEKRRDEFIYDKKQVGIKIQQVNFSYTEK
jgi:hypothetical protein